MKNSNKNLYTTILSPGLYHNEKTGYIYGFEGLFPAKKLLPGEAFAMLENNEKIAIITGDGNIHYNVDKKSLPELYKNYF